MAKKFEAFVLVFLVFITGIMAGYAWRMVHELRKPADTSYQQMTEQEQKAFVQLLKKHKLIARAEK
jgi:hypothetical protein